MRMAKHGLSDPSRRFDGPAKTARKKRAVNLSVDAELLDLARDMGLSPSQVLESALRRETEAERIRRWQQVNRKSLDSYNRLIERAGVFGEELLDLDDPAV
jgi:antitoxin CcdA